MANPTIPVQQSIHTDETVVTMASHPAEAEKPVVQDVDSGVTADMGPPKLLFSIELSCGGCQKGVERKLEVKRDDANGAFDYKVHLDKENGSTVSFWGDIEKEEAEAILTETKKKFKYIEQEKKKCCGKGCCSEKK
ncbi:hypothetical protein SCHPADRAFT_892406 [Schizopora paradoxa]|uniref:HMA domain-containing protein n=1 Tax=Schizopora paradoxa TaxID=27342 RepID=A0A0H2REX2_9AGAM|nr:hypothetical protein SCHPADRAFT_892406 [Schizopora paradoxa]